jgi:hypothetical protein
VKGPKNTSWCQSNQISKQQEGIKEQIKPKYELRNHSDSESDSDDDELLNDIMNKRSPTKHKKEKDDRIDKMEKMMQDMYQFQIKQAKKLKKERRHNEKLKIVLLPPTQEARPKEKQASLSIQDQIKREWFLS